MSTRRFKKVGLRRRTETEAPRSYTVVVCYDGERTEADYLIGWRSVLRAGSIELRPVLVNSGGNPDVAVERALAAKANDTDYDEYWCVCDVDGTASARVQKAVARARRAGLNLALSNRCFEVWAALHWDPVSTAPVMSEKEARQIVAKNFKRYQRGPKVIPFSLLYPRTDKALVNAKILRAAGHANPSTDLDLLVKKLLAVRK